MHSQDIAKNVSLEICAMFRGSYNRKNMSIKDRGQKCSCNGVTESNADSLCLVAAQLAVEYGGGNS